MKLLLLGDTHFTNRIPERRKGSDYFQTQRLKFNQVRQIFREKKCDIILQVGDFFDNPHVSDYVKACLIRDLKNEIPMMPIYYVFGQHDVFSHTAFTFKRSPLAVMQAAKCVNICCEKGERFQSNLHSNESVYIYGASFGQEVPSVEDESTYNILIVHDMIGDRELYPGQELKNPIRYLQKHSNYDLIVAGDYHYNFSAKYNDRVIVNPGCLVRKTINEFDLNHHPGVYIFDTIDSSLERIELDINSIEDTFDLTRQEKKDTSQILKFIEKLKENQNVKSSWRVILERVLNEKKVNESVKITLNEIINDTLMKECKRG